MFQKNLLTPLATAIVLGLSTLLFWVALRQGFVGDDFVWLYNAKYNMNGLDGWMSAFNQMNGSGFYRPMTQQLFFYAMFHLFGLHAVSIHVAVFSVYLVTAFILFRLLILLCHAVDAAVAGTAVFAFANSNYVGISWIAAFSQTGSSFVFVSTLYLYASGRRHRALIGFLLCLLSGEITSTLPAFLFLHDVVIKRVSYFRALLNARYFWLMLAAYIILRFAVLGIHPAGPFGMSSSPGLLFTTFGQSVAWLAGWTPAFHNALYQAYWRIFALVSFAVLVLAVLLPLAFICLLQTREEHIRLGVAGVLWIIIGMSPVLLFSLHNYAAYTLAISLFGLALLVSGAVSGVPAIGRMFVSCAIVVACFAVNFVAIYNPAGSNETEGSNFYSQVALGYAKSIRHCMDHHDFSTVYVVGGGDALTWALGNQWGARIIARNPAIELDYVQSLADTDRHGLVVDYANDKLNLISCGVEKENHQGR